MKYHVSFDLELRRNPYKGLYIAVEGIDGSGKTTQVKEISSYFRKNKKEAEQTREPRKEGIIGNIVQRVLTGKLKMPSVALQYLFSTDRVLHHNDVIIPALKSGKIVVSDRCFWSAIPYGILDRMKDKKEEKYSFDMGEVILVGQSILSMYHQFTVPDYTFFLNVSVDTGIKRIEKKTEKKELYEKRDQLEMINLGYKWLVKKFPKEITVIDGEKGKEEVTKEIIKKLT